MVKQLANKADKKPDRAVDRREWHPISLIAFRFAATYLILFASNAPNIS
jgi:hypothetical protein